MATHDYVIDNSTGANVRTDLNLVLQAILSNNSSSSAPSTTAAYMWWADTSNGILKIRNSSNNGWVELLQLDGTLTLEDGTATAPALANRSNLNTGIYFSAANNFDITTGGSTRVNVSSTGINVTGTVVDDGATHDGDVNFSGANYNLLWDKSDNALEFSNNSKLRIGDPTGIQIYHTGSQSYIREEGTGALRILGDDIQISNEADSASQATFIAGGAVKLFFNGGPKFETFASGVRWTGQLHCPTAGDSIQFTGSSSNAFLMAMTDGNASPANSSTFLNFHHWNGTAWVRTHNFGRDRLYMPDNIQLMLGNSADLKIFHNGTDSRITDTGTGSLALGGSAVFIQNDAHNANMASFVAGASTALHYNGNPRLETVANGVEVFGNNSTIFKASCATNSTADILFQNSENNSSGDIRLLMKVGTNQGADPYIKFDAGGSDMIVGLRYNGSTNNYLALGAGTDVSSVAGIQILGTGIVDLTHTYANPVGGSIRDLYIRSDGRLGYDSSVRASKTNIADLTDISWIDNLIPKSFNKFKQDNSGAFTSENYTELEYGLIAEEVETVNKELCSYSNEGSLEAVHYKKLITPLLKGLQDARKAITTLETKVAALEAA